VAVASQCLCGAIHPQEDDMTPSHHSRPKLRRKFLLAAILSLSVVPWATAQVRVNSIGAGHVIGSHIGGSGQLLPYIRSTQGSGNGQASWGGGVWHGGNTQPAHCGGRPPRPGSSGAGH
jgi:hypothetical protein